MSGNRTLTVVDLTATGVAVNKQYLILTESSFKVVSFKKADRGTGFETEGGRNSVSEGEGAGRAGVLIARNNRCARSALIDHLNHHHYRSHHHSALTELRKIPHGFLVAGLCMVELSCLTELVVGAQLNRELWCNRGLQNSNICH